MRGPRWQPRRLACTTGAQLSCQISISRLFSVGQTPCRQNARLDVGVLVRERRVPSLRTLRAFINTRQSTLRLSMAEDGLPMPSPIPKASYLLSFESPNSFDELAEVRWMSTHARLTGRQKAPRPKRTHEYDRIVPSWNIRTEQDEYLEKMQQRLQAVQNKRIDLNTPVAEGFVLLTTQCSLFLHSGGGSVSTG